MSADPILYCLSHVTDYLQFERLCSDLMAGSGYGGIDPIGGAGDRGRDALHRCESSGAITIFAYTVRKHCGRKLLEDCKRIKEEGHELSRLVFVCARALSGNAKDKARALTAGFGWQLEIYDCERIRTLLTGELRHLIEDHPSIFHPRLFASSTALAPLNEVLPPRAPPLAILDPPDHSSHDAQMFSLEQLLLDGRADVRTNAARDLAKLGKAGAVAAPALRKALRDSSQHVRNAAAAALAAISKQQERKPSA